MQFIEASKQERLVRHVGARDSTKCQAGLDEKSSEEQRDKQAQSLRHQMACGKTAYHRQNRVSRGRQYSSYGNDHAPERSAGDAILVLGPKRDSSVAHLITLPRTSPSTVSPMPNSPKMPYMIRYNRSLRKPRAKPLSALAIMPS